LGDKIKKERKRRGWTQKELCKRCGLSPSLLSQIENGKLDPSLSSLDKIASCFSVHISKLLTDYEEKNDIMHFARKEHIVLQDDGKRKLQLIMPQLEEMEKVLMILKPDAVEHDYTRHSGIEFVYVFQGSIQAIFPDLDQEFSCCAGDSLVYKAKHRHKLINVNKETAKCFIVNLPHENKLNV